MELAGILVDEKSGEGLFYTRWRLATGMDIDQM